MLKVSNLRKNYDGFSLDCSLEVKRGCVTGLIGRNGAGKSTTFKSILGLIHSESDKIELFGKNIKNITKKEKLVFGLMITDKNGGV